MSSVYTVTMPDIGEGVVEGEVVEWLKQIDEEVKQDEPVVIIMTDKATVELPAPKPGKLAKQYYQPGEMAQLNHPLYDLQLAQNKDEKLEKKQPDALFEVPSPEDIKPASLSSTKCPSTQILTTPALRKLAQNLGINLEKVTATGCEGRITEDDVRTFLSKASKPISSLKIADDDEAVPLVGIQHQMAIKMKEAHEVIPPFSYFEQVDATRLIQLKKNIEEEASQSGIKATFMPLFIRALSLALLQFPSVNSSYDAENNRLILHKHHNIGLAFTTAQGLIVPVLKQVEAMGLSAIIRSYENLKKKALQKKLQPSDMREATITISNYGVLGSGLYATPIIHYPEAAILAVAKIQKQPVVKQDQIVACDMLHLSWSFDHRIIDGTLAASFSHLFCSLIQNPAQLL